MRLVNRGIFLLAIIGLLISGYLLERYITNAPIVCGKSLGCDIVRASPYAYFSGIPMPFFGLIFYLAIAGGSFMQTVTPDRKLPLWPLAAAGFAFSLYLFFLEIFVIHSLCFWCLASGIIAFLLFILTIIEWKRR
ncbi:MAG: vitamin K epoxide reductase family protein [Patescibacteria group bacterium]